MKMILQDKRALVTGASVGIGRAMRPKLPRSANCSELGKELTA